VVRSLLFGGFVILDDIVAVYTARGGAASRTLQTALLAKIANSEDVHSKQVVSIYTQGGMQHNIPMTKTSKRSRSHSHSHPLSSNDTAASAPHDPDPIAISY